MANYYEVLSPRPGKDGKTHWTRVGTLFPAREGDGFNLVLDAYPLPDKEGSVRCIARPPKPKDAYQGGQQSSGSLSVQLDDEVPFAPEWR